MIILAKNLCSFIPDSEVPSDSTLLVVFNSNGVKCSVYEQVITLEERIEDAKSKGEIILENFIWQCILSLSKSLEGTKANQIHIKPSAINVKGGWLSLNDRAHAPEQNALSFMAFYEAPETLMRQSVTDKALTWTTGCVIYEIMALDPAYYDRENSGNPMAVMMQITQGKKPPPLPAHYSTLLIDTVNKCFCANPSARPSPNELQSIAHDRLNYII